MRAQTGASCLGGYDPGPIEMRGGWGLGVPQIEAPSVPWKENSLLDVSREELKEFVAEVHVLADGMLLCG